MARWYLVTFDPIQGGFKSLPCCEPAVAAHQCLQCRFDNVAGVSLIKCIRPDGFPPDPMVEEIDPTTDIKPWLETIPRLPKDQRADPPTLFTVDEEVKIIKDLAKPFGN